MSIVEDGGSPLDPRLIRWTGYGLGLASVGAALAAGWTRNEFVTAGAMAVTIAPVIMALVRPELFEFRARNGKRGFNPAVGAGACTMIFVSQWVNFVDLNPLWILALIGTAIGLGGGWLASRRPGVGSPIMLVIFMAIFGACYGPGAFAMADVTFDHSAGTPFQVIVQGQHVSHGSKGGTTYYLDLPPWGPRTAPDSVSVSEDVYDAAEPGQPVCLKEHPGALKQAWYTVADCPAFTVPVMPPLPTFTP